MASDFQLIHLSARNGEQPYFGALRAHGWHIDTVSSLSDALGRLSSNRYVLGIVRLDSVDDFSTGELGIFLEAARDLPWVAVSNPEALENNSSLADIVYNRCADHVSYATQPDALSFSLGQAVAKLLRDQAPRPLIDLRSARDAAEKAAIETALGYFPDNVTKAAAHLGISRMTLYRLLHKHGIAEKYTRTA